METRIDEEFGLMTQQSSDMWLLERTVMLGGAPIPIEIEVELQEEAANFSNALQRQAIRDALALGLNALDEAAPAVVQNYEVYRDAIFDDEQTPPLQNPVDVWQQVRIGSIFVPTHYDARHSYFLIHAECDWSPGHGLAVRFRDGVAIESNQVGEMQSTYEDSPEELEATRSAIAEALASCGIPKNAA